MITRNERIGALAAVVLAALAALAVLAPASWAAQSCQPSASGSETVCTFDYTGAAQSWTVPEGVESATFDVYGAQGGGSGRGGEAKADAISVTPGETLQVNVGGRGSSSDSGDPGGAGGFNGGAAGGSNSGDGGGASDVRSGGSALGDRIIVGGGGGGIGDFGSGGFGGGPSGGGGDATSGFSGGGGGTSSAGGAGGGGNPSGGSGGLGTGGTGATSGGPTGGGGGGGGGGYYGGGGGGSANSEFGGGGGGSSFGPSGVVFDNGVRQGNGLVKITFDTPNQAPVAKDDSATTNEDKATDIDVLSNDSDAEDDTLSVSSFTQPSNGTVSENDDGTLTYTPEKDFNGSDSFTYKATDGTADSEPATVSITVTTVNDAPVAANDSATTNEDSAATITVLANDTDVEGSALTPKIDTQPANGTVTVNPNGSITYTPKKDYNGTDTFTYKANDGTADSNTATVTITVNPVNDAPTISVLAGTGSQSACLSYNTSGRVTLKLSDVDSNLSNLKLSATSSDKRLVPNANVTFDGSGETRTATISTVSGRTGISTVTITASDGQTSTTTTVTVKAGGNGRDTLSGTSGADLLLGQNGDDTLSGMGGSDVLCGANGNDRLSGDGGSDSFDGGSGTDTATDFNSGEGDSRTNIP